MPNSKLHQNGRAHFAFLINLWTPYFYNVNCPVRFRRSSSYVSVTHMLMKCATVATAQWFHIMTKFVNINSMSDRRWNSQQSISEVASGGEMRPAQFVSFHADFAWQLFFLVWTRRHVSFFPDLIIYLYVAHNGTVICQVECLFNVWDMHLDQ